MLGEQVARDERHNRSVGTVLVRVRVRVRARVRVRVRVRMRVRVRVRVRVALHAPPPREARGTRR